MGKKCIGELDNTIRLQILATSDLHGYFMPYDYERNEKYLKGSLIQIANLVKKCRRENPNTILVDNGDTIQGNSSSLFLNDDIHPMIFGMNYMEYDSWTLGNHEFNYGIPVLLKIIEQTKMSVLCGNVYKNGNLLNGTKPYTIIEKAKVRIALIGMVTPHINKWDSTRLGGYIGKNPAIETRKILDEIKGKADIFILISHVGLDNEYGEGDSAREIAKLCPELTAIITGHSHKAIEGVREGNVLITQSLNHGKALSKINIEIKRKGDNFIIENPIKDVCSELLYVSSNKRNIDSDKELEELFNDYNRRAMEEVQCVIGELKYGDLALEDEIKGIPEGQLRANAVTTLINKVQMFYGKADVSCTAFQTKNANLKKGSITNADLASLYRYDNYLMVLKITGLQLKRYMEWNALYYNKFKEGDLTISFNKRIPSFNYDIFLGVKYKINISKKRGNRIENLTYMNGVPVKDTDVIKIAVNSFRGALFLSESFKGEGIEKIFDSKEELPAECKEVRKLIKKYIIEEKNCVIYPEIEENWSLTGYFYEKEKREVVKNLINNGKMQLPKSFNGRASNIKSITQKKLKFLGFVYYLLLKVKNKACPEKL